VSVKNYKEDSKVNLGQCPHCSVVVNLERTEEKQIFICPICLKKCKQHINGKILYNTIHFSLDESEEYP
jgi:uncharacterized paraquat-inducible protein A